MKKSILFLAGAAILMAGCAKVVEENKEVVPEKGERHITLKATVNEPDTRVSVNGSGVYSWQQGDAIAISLNENGPCHTYTTANSSGNTTSFDLTLEAGQELGQYAFYPANDSHGVYKDGYDITFALAAEYDYVIGTTNMPMLGTISGEDISFKAVGGLLQLTVNNVPKNAYYFRVTADQPINGRYIVSENGDINVDEVEWDDDSYSVIFNLFKESGNGEVVRSWASTMTFYIPLPVGTYRAFAFEFLGAPDPDQDDYTPILSHKEASMGDDGLTVNRNDIIVAPNLTLNGVFSFNDYTLSYFPELASDNQEDWIIRIPDNSEDWFYIGFESDYTWEVTFSFPEGEDEWVGLFTPKSVDSHSYNFEEFPNFTDDDVLHTAMMNFNCVSDSDLSFSIPVREYRLGASLYDENGQDVTFQDLLLNFGESLELIADVSVPVTQYEWYCTDPWSGDVIDLLSIVPDPNNPLKVAITANAPLGYCRVDLNYLYSPDGVSAPRWEDVYCYVSIVGPTCALMMGDEDMTFEEMSLEYGSDPITFEAVITGIPEGFRISNIRWYCDDDWQENPDTGDWIFIPHSGNILSYTTSEENPPYSVSVTAGNEDAIGSYDWIDCRFTIENVTTGETFESDEYYCKINVTGNSSSQKAPSAKRSARKPRVFPKLTD